MERHIDRKLTLSREEVEAAIWHYLKEHMDQPVPETPQELRFVHQHPINSKMEVSWSEDATIRSNDP